MKWNLFKRSHFERKLEEETEIKKFQSEVFNKNNLKRNLAQMDSTSLNAYLKFHFPKDGQDYTNHRIKVQVVRSLDKVDLSSAIARMERIEHTNDQKRYFFFIGFIFTTIIAFIAPISNKVELNSDAHWNIFIIVTSIICIALFLIQQHFHKSVLQDDYNRSDLIYFKELLIQAKADKES